MYSYQKESNRLTTPEESLPGPKMQKLNNWFFIFTIFSIIVYSCYTFFIVYKLAEKTFLSKIIVYLLGIYVIVFLILILVNLRNRRKMKYSLKNYKSATKFLKYAIQIINFSLSIITAISAFITTGTTDISALAYAFLSILITIIFIFFEIVSIKIRKNFPAIKQNFLELRDKPAKKKQEQSEQ